MRVSSPQGRFAEAAALLDGSELLAADSAGKHLFLDFGGDRLIWIHLGLIGAFDIHAGSVQPPVGQVRLRLQNHTGYADLRGAMTCELVTEAKRDAVVTALGADPLRLDADPERAWGRVHKSPRSIGDLLMDQKVFAGVGNVYRAEVLFRNKIHPLRPGNTLQRKQFEAIWNDLVGLMAEGVRLGRIDTVREEHTPEAMGRPARVDDHGERSTSTGAPVCLAISAAHRCARRFSPAGTPSGAPSVRGLTEYESSPWQTSQASANTVFSRRA